MAPASLRALLAGVIDYAGLFPPARLDISQAVQQYATYRERPEAWMLGRFVLPFARIDEFIDARRAIGRAGDPWRLSALSAGVPGRPHWLPSPHVAEEMHRFNADFATLARIESVEAAPGTAPGMGLVDEPTIAIPPLGQIEVFVEMPSVEDPNPLIKQIGALGALAKIRTGGVTADAFPTASGVADFLRACARYRVGFKATAGLHHPIRGSYRLTYAIDAPVGPMFGFLNVFAAAAFARAGAEAEELVAILETSHAGDFRFDSERLAWRHRSLSVCDLHETRVQFARSFGSCSFEEPVHDLRLLALL